jgi:hypothetical protein
MLTVKLEWFGTMLLKLKNLLKDSSLDEKTKALEDFKTFKNYQIANSEPRPWERLNFKTYNTTKKLIMDYLVIFWKICVSYSDLICYFFMLLCTISNGGFIYMVYPAMIFGYALMEESRPGKDFWKFVLIYTQVIIILQFLTQLNLWDNKNKNTN